MSSLQMENRRAGDGGLHQKATNPVSNLQLVRMLQDPKVPRSSKIEEAYSFMINQETGLDRGNSYKTQDAIPMAMPQFVSFLSEWVQSAVLWSSKPQQLNKIKDGQGKEKLLTGIPAHLDARYWAILRWCLSSGHLHKFASLSASLMRPLSLYVIGLTETVGSSEGDLGHQSKIALTSCLTEESVHSIEVLLLANERSFRPDLDHWVSLASAALSKFASLNEFDQDGKMMSPVIRLIVCVLEGFARFISIHPNRRKIFMSITENLLESLLIAHGVLSNRCPQVSLRSIQSLSWLPRLLQTIQDILEKSLFHEAHVGFFQDVCTVLAGKEEGDVDIEKEITQKKRKRKNSNRNETCTVEEEDKEAHLSYHRLLFKKLDSFRRTGLELALMEQCWLFETFSKRFKSHQDAEDIDVFGIKTKGKPPSEGEETGKGMHDGLLVDRKDRNSEALFSVFAEFTGPLIKDLKSFDIFLMSHDSSPSREQMSSAKMLMGAIAELLKVAKTENTYVPTQDSTTRAHFLFLRSCFNIMVGIGKSLPSLLGDTRTKSHKEREKMSIGSLRENMDERELKALLSEILREMIPALKHLIELDFKVVENSLGDIWVILLAEAALQQASGRDYLSVNGALNHTKHGAIEVACDIVNIFSDLRQVDQVLFSLCATLRGFMSQGAGVSETQNHTTGNKKATTSWLTVLNLEAIEFVVCAKPLLSAVASAMQALPDGQVPEFLRILIGDALESITLIGIPDEFNQMVGPVDGESGRKCVTVGLKGLVELYCCMLENVKIISTNSIKADKAVQQFAMQIVTPKLAQCIDFFTLSEEPKGILPVTWLLVFLLRLYIATQSLHRECISLMPPKAAKKVCTALDGPGIDHLRGDITDSLTRFGAASFFSGVDRGAVKVSDFLAGIEKRMDVQELADCPALSYSLDCVAIQSLAQLSRQIEAATFLACSCKEVSAVIQGVERKIQKLLKNLKKESQKIAKFLLTEVVLEASITEDTLPVQRWDLLCKSFDIWAKYAGEEDVRKFIACLFSTSLGVQSTKTSSKERKRDSKIVSQENSKKQITDDLLCNALFYEEESFRRIFPSTFREELKKLSLAAFGKWPFESCPSNSLPGIDLMTEKLSSSNQSKNRWSDSDLSALDGCVVLVGQLSALPAGYIELSECATCAHTLLCFERLLINSLLDVRAACEIEERVELSMVFKLLQAFSTCRSALLALTSSDPLNAGKSKLMDALAGSFSSIQWLSSSAHEAMICLVDLLECSKLPAQEKKDVMYSGKNLLYAVLMSTTSLVTYLSEKSFMIEISISPTIEPDEGFLNAVIAYQIEMLVQLTSSSELGDSDNASGLGYNIKGCFQCLVLSCSVSSYIWSFIKFYEEFVKDGTFQKKPGVWPVPSIDLARKHGVVLTKTLLTALVPADSSAVLLLGEHEGKYESVTDETEESCDAKRGLQIPLLKNMLLGRSSNMSEFIGELYLAMAGILKLESINFSGSSQSSHKGSQFQKGLPQDVNLLMGAGYWLLINAADDTQPGHWSHVGWLLGVVKYMEAVYCLTPHMKPPLPPLAFNKLFAMHIHLLGALTQEQVHSLQSPFPLNVEDRQVISIGERNEGDGSRTKYTKATSSSSLRIAVRESLGTLLRTASRQHSVLALQSIMRALVGVSDSNHGSGLEICGLENGKVGRAVAAGIECLSIALEAVSGTKRLRLLSNHFHEFFGAIFNIMEYLQGPHLFFGAESAFSHDDSIKGNAVSGPGGKTVDSGPVILQALQILVTTASRDTIFPMKACHVALALHCPARLFWPVYCSGSSKFKFIRSHSAADRLPGLRKDNQTEVTGVVKIGSELGVKLYVSSCRLLCSVIRHHTRESGHCIALLGDSARVLLHCLEAPNWPSSDAGGVKDWGTKMAAYCGSWLRRMYEEMGEHKETLGKYCAHFLSDYLSVVSGHGPHAAGLRREVEAALQPGAYVLVDACSASDLQQLHASLGEGPRRTALLNLRRQYQQQFKYTGKV